MKRSAVVLLMAVMMAVGTVLGQGDDAPDRFWYLRLGAPLGAVVPTTPDLRLVPMLPEPSWHGPTLETYEHVRNWVRDYTGSDEGSDALEAFVRLLQRTGTDGDVTYHRSLRSDDEDDALDSCGLVGGAGRLVGDGGGGVLFADGGAGRLVGDGGAGRLVGDGGAVLQVRPDPYFVASDVVEPWALELEHVAGQLPGLAGTAFAIVDRFDLDRLPVRDTGRIDREAALLAAADLVLAARDETDGVVVVPHGHLVLHHMLQLVIAQVPEGSQVLVTVGEATGDGPTRVDVSWDDVEGSVRIDLYPMQYDTLDGLEDALASLAADDTVRIVMSWTLSNCVLVERYMQEVDVDALRETGVAGTTDLVVESYAAFLIDLIGLARSGDEAELLDTLCEAFGGVEQPCTDSFLIAVLLAFLDGRAEADVGASIEQEHLWRRVFAAAGNHRMPFPLPPASWPHVYGVAACMPTLTGNAWFTNRGDVVRNEHVLAPGAWYPVASTTDGDGQLGYWGTSFAAPYAALAFTASQSVPDGPHVLGTCTDEVVKAQYASQ